MSQLYTNNSIPIMTEVFNSFSALHDEDSEPHTSCPLRKAHKKLREIEKLKLKMNKTPEEYKKIREEDVWRAIVEPVYTGMSENVEDIQRRKQKQQENTKSKLKILERKRLQEKEAHKKEIEQLQTKRREENERYKKQLIALRQKIQELEHENKKLNQNASSAPASRTTTSRLNNNTNVTLQEKIIEEYDELVKELGTKKKAYQKMMLLYHPDKCESKKIANDVACILNTLKENEVH